MGLPSPSFQTGVFNIKAPKSSLHSKNALTRAHAAETLGNFEVKDAAGKLKERLGDRYRLTRSYAVRALGKLKDQTAIPLLVKCLSDEFFGVRAEAA